MTCSSTQVRDPCPAGSVVETTTNNKCEDAIAAKALCCNNIGNGFCDGLLTDCKTDVCSAANGDANFDFDSAIQGIITDPIEAVCADPQLNPTPPKQTILCDLTGQSVRAIQGNEVCRIDIKDTMVIEMIIAIGKVNSNAAYWENVFHIGNSDFQRWPGIWLSETSGTNGDPNDGFHISYGTNSNWNPVGGPSAAGGAYYDGDIIVYKSIQTQDRLTIIENGITVFDSVWDDHPLATNVPVYISNPWYVAADVVITNLVISSLTATTTQQEKLLTRSFDIYPQEITNYNLKMIVFVMVLIMVCGLGLYYRSKQKTSKEYIALIDTNSEETNPFINRRQYSSCTQV